MKWIVVTVAMSTYALISACSLAERALPGVTLSNADVLGILNTIHHSEIDAGQLARDRASSEEVRAYASRMVNEHQMQMQETDQLAQRMKIDPHNPALAATFKNAHQNAMEDLRDNTGTSFDQTYLAYQIKLHQQAVNFVHATAGSVEDPQLKRFLGEVGLDLQGHLAAAQSVRRQILNGQ